MQPVLITHKIGKTFNDPGGKRFHALEDINLSVARGEFFVLLGPSGCGKSTLLRIASGLEKEFTGVVNFGEGLEPADLGFVFQHFALLPWLSIFDNISLPLVARAVDPFEIKKRTDAELKRFGLAEFAKNFPRELSGGMRQRVGMARALIARPKILFMDEPFSELDMFTADELRKELLGIWHENNMTIVMVTHLIPEALELADRIAVMSGSPGKIEKVVENILPRPRQKRSPEFFHLEDELLRLIRP